MAIVFAFMPLATGTMDSELRQLLAQVTDADKAAFARLYGPDRGDSPQPGHRAAATSGGEAVGGIVRTPRIPGLPVARPRSACGAVGRAEATQRLFATSAGRTTANGPAGLSPRLHARG